MSDSDQVATIRTPEPQLGPRFCRVHDKTPLKKDADIQYKFNSLPCIGAPVAFPSIPNALISSFYFFVRRHAWTHVMSRVQRSLAANHCSRGTNDLGRANINVVSGQEGYGVRAQVNNHYGQTKLCVRGCVAHGPNGVHASQLSHANTRRISGCTRRHNTHMKGHPLVQPLWDKHRRRRGHARVGSGPRTETFDIRVTI